MRIMTAKKPYKRLLLKLSGELLLGKESFGLSQEGCKNLAEVLNEIRLSGYEVSVVIGGGNIFRGIKLSELGLERTPADHMGMLATLINGLALQQALQAIGCPAKVMSALECPKVAESYTWHKALEYLIAGELLIFVGGTGNPYFTTDTAAALRASEIKADLLLKATKVDGVYDKDPLKHPHAKRYSELSYTQFLAEKLQVMDATSIALCMSSKIPVLVFNMSRLGKQTISSLLSDRNAATLIKE